MVDVSVVIPTKNRADCIERAMNSVCNQIKYKVEIIIVDDGSSDNTHNIIQQYMERNKVAIKYIKNKISMGGAKARNIGASKALGKYISFLDSDDEWLPSHLESGIRLMEESNSKGVFGAFYVQNSEGKLNPNNVRDIPTNMSITDYVLSRYGDTRTSTFIFETKCFKEVAFDDQQAKHQDWDLTIRFAKKHRLVVNKEKTVILHYDVSNRMSNSLNHNATEYFLSKHEKYANPKSLVNFYLFLLRSTIKFEGKNNKYYEYQDILDRIIKKNKLSLKYKDNLKRFFLKYMPEKVIRYILIK
ncbi:glycosyltransferase family 2 protein [Oceanobacillus alkalisoli]|uniref:glycosyltransferase family 2 protein n=1 Tax=Oceanobacillus alkalisoli TaxID=2925113 RepID=UPI001F11E3BF|nr:glycosyltransferase family 2 protein [Oceanobacillus alkalisoli]MCF3942621.1 glycosyltransferase [Oceanobacillus alkalisoli]